MNPANAFRGRAARSARTKLKLDENPGKRGREILSAAGHDAATVASQSLEKGAVGLLNLQIDLHRLPILLKNLVLSRWGETHPTAPRWAGGLFHPTASTKRHFPMQNWLKMASSKSSVVVLPTISPTALAAMRRSKAASSNPRPSRNAVTVRSMPARARCNAS